MYDFQLYGLRIHYFDDQIVNRIGILAHLYKLISFIYKDLNYEAYFVNGKPSVPRIKVGRV